MNWDIWAHAAEVHDIGKIIIKGLKHNLEDFMWEKYGISRESPAIQAILKHHCKEEPSPEDIQEYPNSYETLLVHLADMLASQASRVLRGKLRQILRGREVNFGVYKLWKGEVYQA